MKFTVAGHTERGKRDHNEDAIDWYLSPRSDRALVLVADGMGGYAGGEVASSLALEVMLYHLQDKILGMVDVNDAIAQMLSAARAAHHRLLAEQDAEPALAKMGTTLVAGLLFERQLVLLHAGDSRCYRWRAGELARLTRDHTYVEENAGTDVSHHVLTRALGAKQPFDFSVAVHKVQSGDLFAFCTDGLSNALKKTDWDKALASNLPTGQRPQALLKLALSKGADDNLSLVMVQCQ